MIDAPSALIYTMVMVSAVDRDMTEPEMRTIGSLVKGLPAFVGFDIKRLPKVAAACADRLGKPKGLDEVMKAVKRALPKHLRETAYALGCDIAAADGRVSVEEGRLLDLFRLRLGIDQLTAAAIERAARARWAAA
jgi:tellurite resistance protein